MTRRYGPTLGAGTTVTEAEGSKQIEPGALGFAAYPGMWEKGPVGELTLVKTKKEFNAIFGSYYDGTLAPDASEQFFKLNRGAGGIAIVRVTDGDEVAAQATLYTRNGDLRESMGGLKAANGGKWGGKALKYVGEVANFSDITETTLTMADADVFATDQLKGGYIELDDVADTRYEIASNTAAGVIVVLDGYTMASDATSDVGYNIVLENGSKQLTFSIGDGEDFVDSEFSLIVYVDGVEVRKFQNLNTDPTSANYWVSAINDDKFNYYVEAIDGWAGKPHVASARPADYYGRVDAVTATVLTTELIDAVVTASASGSITSITLESTDTDDIMVEQTFTCTFADATTFAVVSDIFGAVPLDATVQTSGSAIVPANKFVPPFNLTTAGTIVAGDVIVVHYKPFVADQLIGGFLYPDKAGAPAVRYRITDNDHKTITIATGYDMSAGDNTDYFQVEKPLPMAGGRDGNADVVDADFVTQAYDIDTSPFNQTFGKNLGILKFATPGWDNVPGLTAAIDVAGLAYAEAKNHPYRVEIPKDIVSEDDAIAYVNSTIGRSDFLVASFPSYGYVMDPQAPGTKKTKLVSLTGMINGREARIAEDFGGYHKAAVGTAATLDEIVKLTTGTAILDEEKLNPVGISVIKKLETSYIIWGDRTCYTDPNWKWKHQREQMSYYEHVLQESFDYIIFAINDKESEVQVISDLDGYFRPEWQKRALRGDSFSDAAIFKMDSENNTDATRAAGDLNVEIQLRLADTVERFNITIGKMGIFESVA